MRLLAAARSLRAKLYAGFAAVLALLVVLGVVGLSQLSSVAGGATRLNDDIMPSLALISTIVTNAEIYRQDQFRHVAAFDAKGMAQVEQDLAADEKAVGDAIVQYRPFAATDPADAARYDVVRADWAAYLKSTTALIALSRANRTKESLDTLTKAQAGFTKLEQDIATWQRENTVTGQRVHAQAKSTADSARSLTIAFIVGAALLALGIAWLVSRGIVRGIGQLLRVAKGIAAGDVEQTVAVKSKDEVGALARAFEEMIAYLRATAAHADRIAACDLSQPIEPRGPRDALGNAFQRMGTALAEVVGQVRESATALAGSSQEVAATAEEMGRAVSEVASAIGDVATGAEGQVRIVDEARQSADEAVTAMAELDARSAEIAGIVATIGTLAEQTNLLALNAAIESARAGEHGRGFAVVAEEVRKLAVESREAAISIDALIADVQVRTARASELVTEQGSASLARVANVANEASASIEQVSASTEETSASTDQLSASARELAGTAERLEGVVARFRL